MSPKRLEYLLGLVGPLIQKMDTNLRKAIPATERLMLTMRKNGGKNVSRIVSETREAIIQVLLQDYM